MNDSESNLALELAKKVGMHYPIVRSYKHNKHVLVASSIRVSEEKLVEILRADRVYKNSEPFMFFEEFDGFLKYLINNRLITNEEAVLYRLQV